MTLQLIDAFDRDSRVRGCESLIFELIRSIRYVLETRSRHFDNVYDLRVCNLVTVIDLCLFDVLVHLVF